MPVFTKEEAKRFASLFAGFDSGDASDHEANGKGRVLRRMAIDKDMRLIDVLELPEIREAIDEQLHPPRANEPENEEDDEEIVPDEETVPHEEDVPESSLPSRIGWSCAAVTVWCLEVVGLIVMFLGACVVGFVIGLGRDET